MAGEERLRPYASYRPSGVSWLGELPFEWECAPLRRLVCLHSDKVDANRDVPLPYVGMENIESWTGRLLPLEPDAIPEGISNRFLPGSVLFGKLRPYLAKASFVDFEGLCSSELLVLQAIRLKPTYLRYALLTEGFISLVDSSTYGAKMPRASWEFVGGVRLPVPSLEEQRSIAAFLDAETAKIDTLIEKKQTLIERLQEQRTALISRTVTRGLPPDAARAAGLDPNPRFKPSGVEWLGEVPEHWEIGKFSREAQIAEGQIDPQTEPYASMLLIAPNHIESKTGQLFLKETAAEQAAESGKYIAEKGNVIYSKIRPALAKVTIAPEQCLCSADMYPINGRSRLQNRYLFWLFLSKDFTEWSVLEADRVAMPKINRETLSELRLPLPPPSEQAKIAQFLERETRQTDRIIGKVREAVESLHEFRGSLITAAVTGKIDVRQHAR